MRGRPRVDGEFCGCFREHGLGDAPVYNADVEGREILELLRRALVLFTLEGYALLAPDVFMNSALTGLLTALHTLGERSGLLYLRDAELRDMHGTRSNLLDR